MSYTAHQDTPSSISFYDTNNILQARCNQLQAANSVAASTRRRTQRRLPHRGQILSVIDQAVENDARLDGEASSSDSKTSKDEITQWLNEDIVVGPDDAEAVSKDTEGQGYCRCVRHFKVLEKPRRR